jgi:hypothetical protein
VIQAFLNAFNSAKRDFPDFRENLYRQYGERAEIAYSTRDAWIHRKSVEHFFFFSRKTILNGTDTEGAGVGVGGHMHKSHLREITYQVIGFLYSPPRRINIWVQIKKDDAWFHLW